MTRKAFNEFAEGFISECIEQGFNEHQSATLLTKVATQVSVLEDDNEMVKYALMGRIGGGFKKMWGSNPLIRKGYGGQNHVNFGTAARRVGIVGAGTAAVAAPVVGGIGWFNNRGPGSYSGPLPGDYAAGASSATDTTSTPSGTGGPNVDLAESSLAPYDADSPSTAATAGGAAAASPTSSGGTQFDRATATANTQIEAARSQIPDVDKQIAAAKQTARNDSRKWAEVDRLQGQRNALLWTISGGEKSIATQRKQFSNDEVERDRQIAKMNEYLSNSGLQNNERASQLNEHLYNRSQEGDGIFGYKRGLDWMMGRTRERADAYNAQRERDAAMRARLKGMPEDYYYPQH